MGLINCQLWISVLYSDVESAVLNGGYSTNYFKVSRGVRQGCPLSPLLFVLGVELNAGLASFLTLPLVGNSLSIQFIHWLKTIN